MQLAVPDTAKVIVVGDTHGQYHDVCRIFELHGPPGDDTYYIFNGDFVDRGAWGLETLALLAAWKCAAPHRVILLRGNHESATCTQAYGFKGELKAKYGRPQWQMVYAACRKMFAFLPLGAAVQQRTLVLHGGLYRRNAQRITAASKGKRKRAVPSQCGVLEMTLGTLDDLRKASKGGQDPAGFGSARLASDVLWSDPSKDPGFEENYGRGIGMIFGPDVTEAFLRLNGLSLILRSHEGPDARTDREDMGPMLEGYTLDHDTPAGKLYTVFSAPDYPQFIHPGVPRFRNKAAVAVLTKNGDFAEPEMSIFEAVLPRPDAQPYYSLAIPDSDEEYEPAASDLSGMTGVSRELVESEGEEEIETITDQKKNVRRFVEKQTNIDVDEKNEERGVIPEALRTGNAHDTDCAMESKALLQMAAGELRVVDGDGGTEGAATPLRDCPLPPQFGDSTSKVEQHSVRKETPLPQPTPRRSTGLLGVSSRLSASGPSKENRDAPLTDDPSKFGEDLFPYYREIG